METKNLRYPLKVYFDGSCRLCRSEVENIAARDAGRRLIVIDCSRPEFDDSWLPVTQAEMMTVFHACDADRQWIRGVDVFIAIYQAAELGWVSAILSHPWVRPYADRYYPWLVRNRYRIAALGLHRILNFFTHRAQRRQARELLAKSQQCRDGACETQQE